MAFCVDLDRQLNAAKHRAAQSDHSAWCYAIDLDQHKVMSKYAVVFARIRSFVIRPVLRLVFCHQIARQSPDGLATMKIDHFDNLQLLAALFCSSLTSHCQYANRISGNSVPKNSKDDRPFSFSSRSELQTKNMANSKITSRANCGVNRVNAYIESTLFISSPWHVKPE